MWQLFFGAMVLFFRGRLFADQREAVRRITFAGIIVAIIACAGVAGDLPFWLAALIGGAIGGGLAPILCINLRMR